MVAQQGLRYNLLVMTEEKLPNYAFIDSQNVNLSIQSLGWKLDCPILKKKRPQKDETLRGSLFYW